MFMAEPKVIGPGGYCHYGICVIMIGKTGAGKTDNGAERTVPYAIQR
ncbi:MAG: hypothetical protein A4E65_03445 [Syntrophorhabdus sp. PtaU1.Bin153]|nr:MAG: hypothetical protein A4E65_03445 [Syntrophorhabdus sp. PtaU1.Bin153]